MFTGVTAKSARCKIGSMKSSIKPKFGEDAFFDVSAIFGAPFARPIVAAIVNTKITPIQLTLASLFFGVLAAALVAADNGGWWQVFPFAAYHLKNIFDTCDGTLARARNAPDRLGRFLDSVVDFAVAILVFAAMAFVAYKKSGSLYVFPLGAAAFLASVMSTSYYVFYTIKFAEYRRVTTASRPDETPSPDDARLYADPRRQKMYEIVYALFLLFYGWQDRAVIALDAAIRAKAMRSAGSKITSSPINATQTEKALERYYTNKRLLFWTSFLGLGCHIMLGSAAMMFSAYAAYFVVTIVYSAVFVFVLSLERIKSLQSENWNDTPRP